MIYIVPTKFVFNGNFLVKAESPEQARQLVQEQCGLTLGRNIHTALDEESCTWEFDMKPEKITGRIRKSVNGRGQSFDDFLKEEGLTDEVNELAKKKIAILKTRKRRKK